MFFGVFVNASNLKDDFEIYFSIWEKEPFLIENPLLSNPKVNKEALNNLLSLGPSIIPLLIEKLNKNDTRGGVLTPLNYIAKNRFVSHFDDEEKLCLFEDYPRFKYKPHFLRNENEESESVWVYWWNEGRKLTPELFVKKYTAYEEAKKSKDEKQIKDAYTKLQNMGVIILPNLLEKIKNGEKDLIPMFSYLSNEKVPADASAEDCEKWWNENKSQYAEILNY